MAATLIDKAGVLALVPKEDLAQRFVLSHVFERFLAEGLDVFSVSEIAESKKIPVDMVRGALTELRARGVLVLDPEAEDPESVPDSWKFTGIRFVVKPVQLTLPKSDAAVPPVEKYGPREEEHVFFDVIYLARISPYDEDMPAGACEIEILWKAKPEDDWNVALEDDADDPRLAWEKVDEWLRLTDETAAENVKKLVEAIEQLETPTEDQKNAALRGIAELERFEARQAERDAKLLPEAPSVVFTGEPVLDQSVDKDGVLYRFVVTKDEDGKHKAWLLGPDGAAVWDALPFDTVELAESDLKKWVKKRAGK